jgi:ubiquinone/menaquinone biosynthesis C-methylase UbiE
MPERDIGGGFRDVDSAGDAPAFIAYLDEAGDLLAGLKAELIAALDLDSGDAALDVGCGTGSDLSSLAAVVGPSGRVVGVDRSEDLVAEARSRTRGSPGVEVLVGDAEALPFSDDEFSAARVERVLMHVDEPRAVLGQLARVTRPAGRVVVTERSPPSPARRSPSATSPSPRHSSNCSRPPATSAKTPKAGGNASSTSRRRSPSSQP